MEILKQLFWNNYTKDNYLRNGRKHWKHRNMKCSENMPMGEYAMKKGKENSHLSSGLKERLY